MASETTSTNAGEVPEVASLFESLFRHRDLSLFLPFVLGSTGNPTRAGENQPNQESPGGETRETASPRDRIILINPFTHGMVVIEGVANLDSLFRDLASRSSQGQPPASKASIEAMPSVEIGEAGGECAICLEEWELGLVVKEMPCKHRFHGNCIEKWLGIHGSCPVCRYNMPVDEEEMGKKRDVEEEEGGGRERRRIGREIWVSFSFNGNRRSGDSDQTPPNSNDSTDASTPRPDHGADN